MISSRQIWRRIWFMLGGVVIALGVAVYVAVMGFSMSGLIICVIPLKPKIQHVRDDMKALAKAIEAYHAENGSYPAWGMGDQGPGGTQTYNWWIIKSFRGISSLSQVASHSTDTVRMPSFILNETGARDNLQSSTTSTDYLGTYPSDPFNSMKGTTYAYWAIEPGKSDPSGKIVGKDGAVSGTGWILVSRGPDLHYDLMDEWDVYDPSVPQPSPRLLAGTNRKGIAFTYDPTNGLLSKGDIWRVKQ